MQMHSAEQMTTVFTTVITMAMCMSTLAITVLTSSGTLRAHLNRAEKMSGAVPVSGTVLLEGRWREVQGARVGQELRAEPNNGLQATASSLRSYVAAASGGA